jgi:hypothetical protein
MMRKVSLLSLACVFSCTGDALYRDIQGTVKSITPTSYNIPISPTPTITILGRSADEFQTEYVQTTLGTPSANFLIRQVPQKNPVIFELKHSSMDTVVSFPYDLKAGGSITLGAIQSGTIDNIINQIETLSGQTIANDSAIILGQLSSEGSANSGCSSINSVAIKNRETGVNVAVVGPFYFNSNGLVVDSNNFADTQCSYVMANVLPGVYLLEFLDTSLVKLREAEVVALEGTVSFGMDVPR